MFTDWRKSTRSGGNGGQCVEVSFSDDAIGVRDSKDPTGPVLVFTTDEWDAFIEGTKLNEFDL